MAPPSDPLKDLITKPDYARFKHSGITHTLLFDSPPSSDSDRKRDTILQLFANELRGERVHHITVPGRLQERGSSSRSLLKFARAPKSKCDLSAYRDKIKEGYGKIVYNYDIGGLAKERDFIFLFAEGEGIVVASAIAQIIDKVGVIEDWAFESNFSLVYELGLGKKYNDSHRENFRNVRTHFARVELFCLFPSEKATTHLDQLNKKSIVKTVSFGDTCQGCSRAGNRCEDKHKVEELLSEYRAALQADAERQTSAE